MIKDSYSLNLTVNKVNQQSAINSTNTAYYNYTDGFSITGSMLYSSSTVLNLSFVGTNATYIASQYPQIINNNVLASSSGGGDLIYFLSASSGNYNPTYINNNTLYEVSQGGTGIQLLQDTATTSIKNNIFENIRYVSKSSAATVSNLTMDYNQAYNWASGDYAYYNSTYQSQAAWIALGFDTHSSTANTTAKLVNPATSPGSTVDFRLKQGSPCYGVGTPLSGTGAPTQDMLYTNYTSGIWDIGAYQFKRGIGF
jgi:hypothetical protein